MKIKNAVIAMALSLSNANLLVAGELNVFTSDVSGFNTHSFWYDDGKEVTVVDSQFTYQIAEKLINDIKLKTKSPITRIILTHPNPDKFNALAVFHQNSVESISSKKTADAIKDVDAYKRYYWTKIAKVFTDENYPKVEPVKTTYTGKKVIELKSGETLTLFELPEPAVSTNHTVVRIDKTGDLIVGDLVHSKNHAWLEGGIVAGKATPTLAAWKAGLQQLLDLGTGKVYGGRGVFLPVKQAVSEQIAYLNQAETIVDNYINKLGADKTELTEPAAQARHYAAIQAELANAFPDYAMPELVGYSIYALLQQKLAQ